VLLLEDGDDTDNEDESRLLEDELLLLEEDEEDEDDVQSTQVPATPAKVTVPILQQTADERMDKTHWPLT